MGGDHTAGVFTGRLLQVDQAPPTTEAVDFTLASVAGALLFACLAAIPLGVTLWALLDAARRPRWAWALAGRRQVVWMAAIMFGALSVVGGVLIPGWYLLKVRPAVAAAEAGEF